MRATIILADFAEAGNGKVHLLGGGWSLLKKPAPMSVVVFLECPWDQTNTAVDFTLELLDADGQPVVLPGPAGPQPLRVEGQFESGRPPGHPKGTPVTLPPLVTNLGPLPLQPGRYVWQFSINGATEEEWSRAFTMLAPPKKG